MRMMTRVALCLAVAVCATSNVPGAEFTRVGRQVEEFELRDYRGKTHRLSDYADAELVVVAFLGTECPLVKLYGPRLTALAAEFESRGVTFLGINSNVQDNNTEIASYARVHEIPFPILKDPGNVVADQFAAVRTPEVFVLDGERNIRYWGRIDDQYNVGIQRPEPTRNDLAIALEELLAGEAVSMPETDAPGCHIGRVTRPAPHGDVTYSNQIARLMQNQCVECHRPGEIAPFPLTNYDEVVGWSEMIREVVEEGRMPPWFANPEHGSFRNDRRMTDEDKQLIYRWVENGSPEGDPSELPEPRQFTVGWGIPEPDEVYYIDDEPFTVPAEGVVDYQYFTVDPGWTEDKWIQASEARPDNRAVVHHIIVFAIPPGGGGGFQNRSGIGGYAPGSPPSNYPAGMAMYVPAGSKLAFQMHYTPNGSVQHDRSYVGVKFADPETVTHRVRGNMVGQIGFSIPPHAPNHQVTAKRRIRRDTVVISMLPHMHLRGKSFRFELEHPSGEREVLLDVPCYDFNWQLDYEFAEPKLLPKGSTLHCTAHYDNSEDNLANPNPDEEVTFGEQTWEEMMFGFYQTVEPLDKNGSL